MWLSSCPGSAHQPDLLVIYHTAPHRFSTPCCRHTEQAARTRPTATAPDRAPEREVEPMTTYVFDFAEGDKDQKDLLGGKGANLAAMGKLGLPVPPGFTISTEACRAYLAAGEAPAGLDEEVAHHLATLEETRGKKLGDAGDPLLVSVRSGAKFSMPGM